ATSYYPAGVSSPSIQSGQAFFVRSSGAAGSVTFTETCKIGSNRLVNRISPVARERRYFRATLFTQGAVIADGNAVVFDPAFDNGINADDAYKFPNAGENFGLVRNGQKLSVEARRPVNKTDTLFYSITNLRKLPYELRFAPKNMQNIGFKAYLIDNYLHNSTELSLFDSSFITININNDSLSYAADRFFVVFKKRDSLAPGASEYLKNNDLTQVDFKKQSSSISVYPNPVENKIIQLHFINQAAGTYQLKLTNNLGQPVYSSGITVSDFSSIHSINVGHGLPSGSYLLNALSAEGKKTVLRVLVK
ncbi:MAG: T9SS type A sorting domain-containing protein, partial [Ferruginibacter sp.]|nr:T9SS type A sorting domain-containing protein [Ferruginibacter sp.]